MKTISFIFVCLLSAISGYSIISSQKFFQPKSCNRITWAPKSCSTYRLFSNDMDLTELSEEALLQMNRKDIQLLAKKHGIKANLSNKDIIQGFLVKKKSQTIAEDEDETKIPVDSGRGVSVNTVIERMPKSSKSPKLRSSSGNNESNDNIASVVDSFKQTPVVEFKRYYNPKHPEYQINEWFDEIGKSLLTIGSKGPTPSQANSLRELLSRHSRVRVKLSNDKMDAMSISKYLQEHEVMQGSIEVLVVRKREILFGHLPNSKILDKQNPQIESLKSKIKLQGDIIGELKVSSTDKDEIEAAKNTLRQLKEQKSKLQENTGTKEQAKRKYKSTSTKEQTSRKRVQADPISRKINFKR